MKAEVKKLEIDKLVNVLTSLKNLKTKVYELDVGKLKTVLVGLQTLSDVKDKQVVKNTKFNTLKTKVNKLDKKVPDLTTLIYVNQHNTNKQNLEKKMKMLIKKPPDVSCLVTNTVLNAKISELKNKIPVDSDVVKKTDYDTKI